MTKSKPCIRRLFDKAERAVGEPLLACLPGASQIIAAIDSPPRTPSEKTVATATTSTKQSYNIAKTMPKRVHRIPASELNQVVEALLLELLSDTNNLIDNLSAHAIDAAKLERLTESAATLHAQWGSYSIAEKIPLLSIVDAAVVVSANRVKLSVSCTGLCNLLLKKHSAVDEYEKGSHDESSTITLSRAVSLRR